MQGRCTVSSAMLRGVEAIPVSVEVAITQGLPGMFIVGMADAAVQEARERVKIALRSSGYAMPNDRVVVNLAPSSLKKGGSAFDLPIAVGILVASGQVDPKVVSGSLFVGEISLDGEVKGVSGLLAYALCARDHGFALVCAADAHGLFPMEGLRALGLETLGRLRSMAFSAVRVSRPTDTPVPADFAEVAGNEMAKRALQIAACGAHGILMMGPPGSGKTMLASRVPSILPELGEDEALETAIVHSVAGEPVDGIFAGSRPFRAPHHSATGPGLIGGGNPIRPGEISLANNGVLFLDELPEYRPSVLQQLRQPMEAGRVTITRADGTIVFPASFMLVAASNPCPCGYFGDPERPCSCTERQVRDYQARIGGPLLDRIDLHIDVRRVPPHDVIARGESRSSADLREGVLAGRAYASWRRSREGRGCGAQQASRGSRAVVESCRLSPEDEAFFEGAVRSAGMSGRAILRTLSVARTIADMEESAVVGRAHLCEALGFRLREGIGR